LSGSSLLNIPRNAPFGVYSIFPRQQTYTRTNLIPTLQPPQSRRTSQPPQAKANLQVNATADMIGKFVKEIYDASMVLVAILEILLWAPSTPLAITFSRGSWVLIAVYTAFLAHASLNLALSGQFRQLEARIDALIGAQSTPSCRKKVWDGVKGGARQFHRYH